MISFDALEIRDHAGHKFTVFSVIDVATSFHMATIVKEGGGAPSSGVLGWMATTSVDGPRTTQSWRNE